MFKNNTNKLEDLWLQLLEFLNLKNTNQYTVFKKTHYSTYISKVIKHNVINKIIQEATKWVNNSGASDQLESFLLKIKEIEKESQFIPEKYENFKQGTYLDCDLNEVARKMIKAEYQRKQQQLHDRNRHNLA